MIQHSCNSHKHDVRRHVKIMRVRALSCSMTESFCYWCCTTSCMQCLGRVMGGCSMERRSSTSSRACILPSTLTPEWKGNSPTQYISRASLDTDARSTALSSHSPCLEPEKKKSTSPLPRLTLALRYPFRCLKERKHGAGSSCIVCRLLVLLM